MAIAGVRPTITVLICTLNEAENLPHVLPKVPNWINEVLIVDGHSTDGTVEVALSLRPNARIMCQSGRGKGNALRFGVQEAIGEIIVTIDGDGETDPSQLSSFVEALRSGYEFAKGSRLAWGRPKRMPFYRWVGNKILAYTFNLLYDTCFTDICSGYNAFWKGCFLQLVLTYENCEMEQQVLARATKAGMRIVEIPHSSIGRIFGESKVSGVKQGLIDWFVIVRERFAR
jgi:glycosyltransferase involved in cell wall biosynthesis